MSGRLPALPKPGEGPVKCPVCQGDVSTSATTCPACGGVLATLPVPLPTIHLSPSASVLPPARSTSDIFDRCASVILQFQPTGICVSLALPQPMVLGRGAATNFSTFLDLTDLGAVQHGVSRHHAQLRRDGNRLMIQDLGSTNGTFLNELRLIAHKDYLVQHCARVRLGTLEVVLAFSDLD
jgi:hypothetical protein